MPLARKTDHKYTYRDYLTWPDDERWEIIEGNAYAMTPAPTMPHQNIVRKIISKLDIFFENKTCVPYIAPADVVLDDDNIVQPDIFVVCDKNKIKKENLQGAPDLIVEILSPSTAAKDGREKKNLYERFGVREYIMINPEYETVERYFLNASKYGSSDLFDWHDKFTSLAFPDLTINLWEVFGKELPEK